MTSGPILPETAADPELRDRALAQLDRLDELAAIGMTAARKAGGRIEEAGAEADLAPLVRTYSRAARAVRLAVMLHARIVKDLRDGDRADREGAEESEAARREDRKTRVENLVYRKAERVHGEDLDAIDKLMNEACERLDQEDLHGELMTRPVPDMVEDLCRELGLDGAVAPAPSAEAKAAGAEVARRAPTEQEWREALAEAAVTARQVLAELRPDSS